MIFAGLTRLLKRISRSNPEQPALDEAEAKPATPTSPYSGSSLSTPERRHMTVMFCDLVGSTEHATGLDPEDMHELLAKFQQTAGQIATKHGGHVAKLLGDGVMVYFGFPHAREDDAERSISASLEILAAVQEIRTPTNETLRSRVGIASGSAIVGEIRAGGGGAPSAISGSVPHLAARLEAAAMPNTVLISEPTRRLVGELFQLEAPSNLPLKGFEQPVSAYRVIGMSNVDSRYTALRAAHPSAFVGRNEEFEALYRRWRTAIEGKAQTVLLSGDPGMGKSRLVERLLDATSDASKIVLRFQCSPQHSDAPYYPFIEQLRRMADLKPDDNSEVLAKKLETSLLNTASDFGDTAPLFGKLLGIKGVERFDSVNIAPEKFKPQVFEAISSHIIDQTNVHPVLVIFEDFHWADPISQELLGYLVGQYLGERILSIVTTRPVDLPSWTSLHDVDVLDLARLDPVDASRMVDEIADGSLPSDLINGIVERADGVPLFVEELTKALLERQEASQDGPLKKTGIGLDDIPSTIHDSLASRLDRLAKDKQVVQLAAAIGRSFQLDLLADCLEQSKSDLAEALAPAVEAGILTLPAVGDRGSYEFKHALLRDAAYDSLTRRRRREFHSRIALSLERNDRQAVETDPGLLAQHFILSGEESKSLAYLLEAGRIAHSRFALQEAVNYYRRGLDIIEQVEPSREKDATELKFQAALGATLNSQRGYAAQETADVYRRAYELLNSTDDLQFKERVLNGLSAVSFNRGDLSWFGEIADEKLANAKAAGAVDLFSSAYRSLALLNSIGGNFSQAVDYGRQAYEHIDPAVHGESHRFGPHNVGVGSTVHYSLPLWHVGNVADSDRLHEEALNLAHSTEHLNTICYAILWLGLFGNLMRRDLEAVISSADELSDLATRHGLPHWQGFPLCYLAYRHMQAGDTDAALASLKDGQGSAAETKNVWHAPVYATITADVLRSESKFEDALVVLDQGLTEASRIGEHWFDAEIYRMKGEIALEGALGDESQALEWLKFGAKTARSQNSRMYELRLQMSLLANATTDELIEQSSTRIRELLQEITPGTKSIDASRAEAALGNLGLAV